MATKKSNGTSITSLFENIEEKGFGELGAEDLRTPRISIVQALSPQRQKTMDDINYGISHDTMDFPTKKW